MRLSFFALFRHNNTRKANMVTGSTPHYDMIRLSYIDKHLFREKGRISRKKDLPKCSGYFL